MKNMLKFGGGLAALALFVVLLGTFYTLQEGEQAVIAAVSVRGRDASAEWLLPRSSMTGPEHIGRQVRVVLRPTAITPLAFKLDGLSPANSGRSAWHSIAAIYRCLKNDRQPS